MVMFSLNYIKKVNTMYKLQNNFILDFEVIIYIYNNIKRFTHICLRIGSVIASNTVFNI